MLLAVLLQIIGLVLATTAAYAFAGAPLALLTAGAACFAAGYLLEKAK